ncbi:MAG TPA: ribosome silencing factor [Candidatus Limnocylindrales bacterium]
MTRKLVTHTPTTEDPDPVTDAATKPRPDGLPSRRTTRVQPAAEVAAATDADTPVAPPAATEERSSLELARRIVELAEDKKAADITILDLTGLTTLADYFVICSGGSDRQLDAIATGVVSGLRDEKVRPFGREGTAASHWILVDFGSVIVHVFTPPERDFYQLERHWAEARTILRVQ